MIGAIAAAMAQFGIGYVMAFPGVMLPSLTNQTSGDIYLQEHQVSVYSEIFYVYFGTI